MAACNFKATVDALADIRQWLDAQLRAELAEAQITIVRTRIITAATEWVTNVLRHASVPASEISVEFKSDDRRVEVCISDDSESSDPFHNPEISALDDISPLATGGRGLAMIIAMTDANEYKPGRTKGGRNKLNLVFSLV